MIKEKTAHLKGSVSPMIESQHEFIREGVAVVEYLEVDPVSQQRGIRHEACEVVVSSEGTKEREEQEGRSRSTYRTMADQMDSTSRSRTCERTTLFVHSVPL